LFTMTVSDLLEQPYCDKSDNAIKLVTSYWQFVPNLLQQLGISSAKTTCWQLVNRFVTTCLQTCNNLCVFTCVPQHVPRASDFQIRNANDYTKFGWFGNPSRCE
jgi:hypothetical protein